MPGQYLYVLERDGAPIAAYTDDFEADGHYEDALCEGEDVVLFRYADIDQMLQTLDHLQFKAAVKGDDDGWERLAVIRTEVNVARAGFRMKTICLDELHHLRNEPTMASKGVTTGGSR